MDQAWPLDGTHLVAGRDQAGSTSLPPGVIVNTVVPPSTLPDQRRDRRQDLGLAAQGERLHGCELERYRVSRPHVGHGEGLDGLDTRSTFFLTFLVATTSS